MSGKRSVSSRISGNHLFPVTHFYPFRQGRILQIHIQVTSLFLTGQNKKSPPPKKRFLFDIKQQSWTNELRKPTAAETAKATRASEVMPLRDHGVAAVTFDLPKRALQTGLPSTMGPPLCPFSAGEKARRRGNNSEKETKQRRIDFLIPMNFFPLPRARLRPLPRQRP